MKYKAKYGAESDIPADVKAFYVLKDGEWVFNGTEFEGLDALLNPGLAGNRDAFKAEKLVEKTRADLAEKERDRLQGELNKASKPGTVFMDSEEKKTLDDYKALGTPKDIKEKLDNEKIASEKLGLLSQSDELRLLAKDTGLNEDALLDFKLNSERGKHVVLGSEKRKIKDEKTGKEEEKLVAVVKITNNVNGKEQVETKLFNEYAKENHYPEYLTTALFNQAAPVDDRSTKGKGFVAPPSMSQRTSNEGDSKVDVKKVVGKFNEERSTRKMPWSTPQEKTENS
jgi:hypothetical protein